MTTLKREDQGEVEETWQAFYSERAQREYYFHPKTRIVTWILPDDENYNVHNDLNDRAEHETHDAQRNEIPRGFVVVDTNRHHASKEPKLMSGQTLTVVMLVVSAIVTGISWGLNGVDSGATELRGRTYFDDLLPTMDSPMVVTTTIPECTSTHDRHGVGSIVVEREDGIEGLISTNALADGTPHGHESLTVFYKEAVDALLNKKSIVATRSKEGNHRELENFHDAEGSELDLSRSHDATLSPLHMESHAQLNSATRDDATALNSTPSTVSEPADADASNDVAILHVQHRVCYVPFAHVFSRICRQEARDRPLFNVDALVEAIVML